MKRDRDYSTHITWTYDLNKDLYKCYKDTNKSIYGHATRMKDLWDKRHSMLAHLTSKHLTTQATRVIKKKLIPEVTEDDITCNKTDQNDNQICERLEPHNQTTENIPQNSEHLEVDNQTIETSENIPLPTLEPVTDSDKLMEMIKMIKPDWMENYNRYLEIEITNHNFLTKKDRRIDDLEILAANRIMDEVILTEVENINLWKINVMQYTTAITLLARHGRLREKKNVRTKRKTPGWILNIENRINAIRRKISHVTLILKCIDVNNMTRKQSNIRRKLKRMYGASRLEEVEANLKHELAVESKKLRDKKIIAERQRINTLFNTNTKSVFREFRKDKKIDVAEPPPKEAVKQF